MLIPFILSSGDVWLGLQLQMRAFIIETNMVGGNDDMSVAELTSKIESLSVDDYNMVVMLIDRLSSIDGGLKKSVRMS